MSSLSAIPYLWGAWFLSWLIAASWSNRVEARPARRAELAYRAVTFAGAVLLLGSRRIGADEPDLWEMPPAAGWCLIGLAVAGFGLCWWARIHLGRLWSSFVTLKADHRIIDTGPYAFVRHPIYTGIIIAAAATAVAEAKALALAGLVLVVVGFWMKARLEERFLRKELGAEAYDAYAKRTGMLFPGF